MTQVKRIYVEKKPELACEAQSLAADIRTLLHIDHLTQLRLINRYDVEGVEEELFCDCVATVFSEPQLDITYTELPTDGCKEVFAVEYLPGQFDQRADSAAQCIQIISQKERPLVRSAKVYLLYGDLSDEEISAIKKYLINPIEAREAGLGEYSTLATDYEIPADVAILEGFCQLDENGLAEFIHDYSLAMDLGDALLCRDYFRKEQRDPSLTEIRMLDTYWSDHCRHTTFLTAIDEIHFPDSELEEAYQSYLACREELNRTKPVTLMDIATLATRYLKAKGQLPLLDESEEVNACSIKIKITVDGEVQDWLLMFKNETHNHPTEIEPFGGAATCIGGAIRDPLSGRSYVYAAMRVTGAADPLAPVNETLAGKLPQRKIVTTAAAGYSSYGNQIGLATGIVDELYHPGYAAKRMEIGAVIAAAPAENVRRECPQDGDIVILLGGRTGRDGCGGATGSSKSHTLESLETCGAEVQKGNAPEERKLQRLFRNAEAAMMIKRCNDFGAGGVSVAIGELADGMEIDLDAVPKKYEGLDGTELAISESQERMAVVVEAKDAKRFMEIAEAENLEATKVSVIKDNPRLIMRWRGKEIVNISREFLNSNGAKKHISINAAPLADYAKELPQSFTSGMKALVDDLNICSKRGLSERFDSTIGAGTVLMPFGGKYQLTPIQAMVNKISLETGDTNACSYMAWGYNPYLTEKSPYHGAYLAVVESIAKLIATGADFRDIYLSFQEYFEKPGTDKNRWGKPLSALLGAFRAQLDLGCAAIGGKDSMSGSFEDLHVPPTLVSFAVTYGTTDEVVSPEFKQAGSHVVILRPRYNEQHLPEASSLIENFRLTTNLMREGKVRAAYTPGMGGIAEAIFKMCLGNGIGFNYADNQEEADLFGYSYGSLILELADADINLVTSLPQAGTLGLTTAYPAISYRKDKLELATLEEAYENKLEPIYPCNIIQQARNIPAYAYYTSTRPKPSYQLAHPQVLIPVFPGTNCEYDTARALREAGANPEIIVINNMHPEKISESVAHFADKLSRAQILFIPGGFSGGDEPDGSGKFITAFLRNAAIKEEIHRLLEERDGLICGICNGFQALIKLGLVPYGEILTATATSPTLTFNTINRHQSKIIRTRVASNKSPWLMYTEPGEVYSAPISHGEGRFLASEELITRLAANGQIATQYADLAGNPSYDVRFNPNDSAAAIEGITSPDGRVFGKMGHAERVGKDLYRNVDGNYQLKMFRAAVDYFAK